MEKARNDDLALDIPAVCEHLWQVIGNLGIVRNRACPVPRRCTTSHPTSCHPWTAHGPGVLSLVSRSPQNAQAATFTWTFIGLAQVGRAVKDCPPGDSCQTMAELVHPQASSHLERVTTLVRLHNSRATRVTSSGSRHPTLDQAICV
jgi:hypothetical protein